MAKITRLFDVNFSEFLASPEMADAEIVIRLYNGPRGKIRADLRHYFLCDSGDFHYTVAFGNTENEAIENLKYQMSGQYYLISTDIEKDSRQKFQLKRFPFFKA